MKNIKKVFAVVATLGIMVACSTVSTTEGKEVFYHSKSGYTHSHLTLKQDDSSTYDVDLEFEGKDLDFEVKKVADNKFESEGAIVEFLNNNEVRITIDGKVIEFFMLDGHEGHGHGHEHHHNH